MWPQNDTIVIGPLASFAASNNAVLETLGVSRRSLPLLRRRLISSAINVVTFTPNISQVYACTENPWSPHAEAAGSRWFGARLHVNF